MSVNCNYTLGFNETQNSLKVWHLISFTLGNLKDHAGLVILITLEDVSSGCQ